METLTAGDTISRLSLAQDPVSESQTLWQLIDDANTTVANVARHRLGLALRPLETATGRIIK